MDEKDDTRRHGARFRSERVKSRNLSEKKRRDQFNMLINELCSMVTSSNRKLDKSSVLRSAISFLRNHSEKSAHQKNLDVQENWKPSFLSNEEFTRLMLEVTHQNPRALDGFIMVFSSVGKILYTSESVAALLGYLPSDIPSSVFDMVHERDCSALYKLINSSAESTSSKDSCFTVLLHMKRGPIFSQGNASYELVRLVGAFHHWPSSQQMPLEGPNVCNLECDSNSCSSICSPLSSTALEWPLCFVAVARLQTPQLLRVVSLADELKNEFTSRHSLEWTFLFLDHRAPPIIGYLPFEVLGTSGYDYYHVGDLESIAAGHKTLMHTGEGTSCYYRFLTKGQQWIWLQTRYYISYHQWSSKPEFVVCTNVVVGNEHVQNNFRKNSLKSSTCIPKADFINLRTTSETPNQSSCVSPGPSSSSLCSLSSEHSERLTATPAKSNSVLLASHGEQENSVLSIHSERNQSAEKDESVSVQPSTTYPSELRTLTTLNLASNCPQTQQRHQTNFRTQASVMPFVTIATVQPSFVGLHDASPVTTVVVSEAQCETSPSTHEPLIMTPSQTQLQDYLQKRHQLLQQQILLQQEELKRVSEQLMVVQFVAPAVQSVSYQVPVNSYSGISETSIPNVYSAHSFMPPQSLATQCVSGGIEPFNALSTPRSEQLIVSSNNFVSPSVPVYTSQGMPLPFTHEPSLDVSSRGYSSKST